MKSYLDFLGETDGREGRVASISTQTGKARQVMPSGAVQKDIQPF